MGGIVLISTDKEPTPPTYGGAIGLWVFEFAKELARRDCEVHIIGVPNTSINYDSMGITFHKLLKGPKLELLEPVFKSKQSIFASFLNVMKIINALLKQGPIDVIQAHYFNTWIAPLILKARLKIQVWHNVPKANFINKFIAKKYNLICGVSKYIVNKIIKHLRITPEKTALLYDFVDTRSIKPDDKLRKVYREKLGLEDVEVVVLYVGRIIPQKGLHCLLVAFAKALNEYKDMKLLIVGPRGHFHVQDTIYFNYLKRLINLLHIREKVHYLGRVSRKHLLGIYNASDIVAIPTLMEEGGLLLANLEAMACGKPVVAYNSGALKEAVIHRRTGVLVEKGNINLFSHFLLQLAEDANYRKKLGYSARKLCEERFDVRKTVDKALELYLQGYGEEM